VSYRKTLGKRLHLDKRNARRSATDAFRLDRPMFDREQAMTQKPRLKQSDWNIILTAASQAAQRVASRRKDYLIGPSGSQPLPEDNAAKQAADDVVAACLSAVATLHRMSS